MTRGGTAAALIAASLAACASQQTPRPIDNAPVALRVERDGQEPLTAGSLRGKVVLITVMTTWAEPALLEVPRLKALHERYPADHFAIVSVALDDTGDAVQIFKEVFAIPYEVGIVEDREHFAGEGGPLGAIRMLPTSVLLDREGRIVARQEGMWPAGVLEEGIDRLLAADRSSR